MPLDHGNAQQITGRIRGFVAVHDVNLNPLMFRDNLAFDNTDYIAGAVVFRAAKIGSVQRPRVHRIAPHLRQGGAGFKAGGLHPAACTKHHLRVASFQRSKRYNIGPFARRNQPAIF